MLAGEEPIAAIFPAPMAFNVLSDWKAGEGDYSEEELKMVFETRKILGEPTLAVSPTTVRVPVENGHSEAIWAEFARPMSPEEAKALLAKAPGVILDARPYAPGVGPNPRDASGRDEVFVGRVRADVGRPGALTFFVVADNLRKGAATNAVQIALGLVRAPAR
jgi:aspartate-semialdehyde dehydrogenase